MLLPTGKSITINQLCRRKQNPGPAEMAPSRVGCSWCWLKIQKVHQHMRRGAVFYERDLMAHNSIWTEKIPPMTPCNALPSQESISMGLVRRDYWLTVSIHESPMPRRVEGAMHHYMGSTWSTRPQWLAAVSARPGQRMVNAGPQCWLKSLGATWDRSSWSPLRYQ